MSAPDASGLVGREDLVARVRTFVSASNAPLLLLSGESGIGKTSLVRAAAADVAPGTHVAWGASLAGAPAYWPWRQALATIARRAEVPTSGHPAVEAWLHPSSSAASEASPNERLLFMDATARWLDDVAMTAPVLIVLDDLQWADDDSLALLEFLLGQPRSPALRLIALCRTEALGRAGSERLRRIASQAERLDVAGLDRDGVGGLLAHLTGRTPDDAELDAVFRRTAGHPLFTRELALRAGTPGSAPPPALVREAIRQRLADLPETTLSMLQVASLGASLTDDVLAECLGVAPEEVGSIRAPAVDAGVVVDGTGQFVHDLFRETIADELSAAQRTQLHHRLATALEHRAETDEGVAPAAVAWHYLQALTLAGAAPAAQWSLRAAEADRRALAFTEAAARLNRLRTALAEHRVVVDDAVLVEVLLAEADALARAGNPLDARGLLRLASDRAATANAGEAAARVALAVVALGSTFATRRDDVVRELERGLHAISGLGLDALEAQLTAAMARELQHSVADDRPRARPLSEEALRLARRSSDPETVLTALLARHDVEWTAGRGAERADIATEIVEVARRSGAAEREAEGQLLLANALLEQGSAAFVAALEASLRLYGELGHLRHRYVIATRRACVALLRGDAAAAALVGDALELGRDVHDPDAANVFMSQRLELVRASGDADALAAFADEAVAHWRGAPVHAHSVAAGFAARAGDLTAAKRHVATVLDLGAWREDRSYLWSVYVRELSVAAAALGDREVCAQLLADVAPHAESCGVNGAVVAFAGSHAETVALLARALDEPADAYVETARAVYDRLGATAWSEGLAAAPARGRVDVPEPVVTLRQEGRLWRASFNGTSITLPASKGLADIATLLAAPDKDVHVLSLMEAGLVREDAGEVSDRAALVAYRNRLAAIDEEAGRAEENNDLARLELLADEREAVLTELRGAVGHGGAVRRFSNNAAERARKAVTARIRDAVRRIAYQDAELAAHLDARLVTGTFCRYRSAAG